MRRTKEQAAETRHQLLLSAEALFLDKGYENVTLDEIAASAGASRGALHWHFCNKQGLLAALRDKAQVPLQELADALKTDITANPLELLGNTISEMFLDLHNDERRRGLIRVMKHLEISVSCELNLGRHRNEPYLAIAEIFSEANRKQRLVAPWTPRTAACALTAAVIGLVEEWALERSELQLVPYGQDLVRSIIRSFSVTRA
jgi:AcrR family transcriptional regulator